MDEEQMRNETFCRGCQGPKDRGLVVCWPCFKYRKDITPLKYWAGDVGSWLAEEVRHG